MKQSDNILEYVHLKLGEDIFALAGYYTPLKEFKLEWGDREVLCVTGTAAVESSCCGATSCAYAIVPGYIVNWKETVNNSGLPVSKVEPINDEKVRRELTKIIKESEYVTNIDFW